MRSRGFIARASIVLTVAVAAAGAAAAETMADHSSSKQLRRAHFSVAHSRRIAFARHAMITKPSRAEVSSFSVLSLPASAGGVPQELQAGGGAYVLSRLGANTALARNVTVGAGTATVIPGNGYLCLHAVSVDGQLGGMDCVPTAKAVAGGDLLETGAIGAGGELIAGLVPDGVTSVTVNFSDGHTQNVTVTNNVYMVTITQAASSLQFAGPTGTSVMQLWN